MGERCGSWADPQVDTILIPRPVGSTAPIPDSLFLLSFPSPSLAIGQKAPARQYAVERRSGGA